MSKKPVVAIVGKSNVGKSKLFNRLIKENKSIVADEMHVTRDRIYGLSHWLGREFVLIDTGGLEVKDVDFMTEIKYQVEIAIEEADIIIFVVSNLEEITHDDEMITKMLHKTKKPVVLAVNKTDNKEMSYDINNFYSLGFETIIPVSAIHGIGIGTLLDEVVKKTNFKEIKGEDYYLKFSALGKVNVGKSTFVNTVFGEARVITSEKAGTTRDSVDVPFTKNKKEYLLIDTAGIRKQKKIHEVVEKYAVLKSKLAVDQSNICLLFIDASTPLSEQDEKIAGIIKEANKPMIVIVNKMDLVKEKEEFKREFKKNFLSKFKFIKDPLVMYVSALRKTNIEKIFDQMDDMVESYTRQIKTSELNGVLQDLQMMKQPGTIRGRKLKICYGVYENKYRPNFILFVNNRNLCHFSYLRYIENQIRQVFPFPGIPIKISLRDKKGDEYE